MALYAPLPAQAQDIDIGDQTSVTTADNAPAFLASFNRLFNTPGHPTVAITSGTDSPGIVIDTGTVDLAGGGSITTSGPISPGVLGIFDNSFYTGTNVHILTTGDGSEGVSAEEGSTMVLNGGTIRTEGAGSVGLHANHFDTNRITSSAVITTIGPNSAGAFLNGLGFIHLTGGSITTMGDGSHGLLAGAAGGVGEITSVIDITTHGANAFGALSNGSPITLNGGTITTTGPGSHGLVAGTAITSVANVTTSGAGSHGALATAGGTITLNGGTITTTGPNAHGLFLDGAGSSLAANGVTVNVSGAGSAGVVIQDATGFTITNSQVTSAQGNALLVTAPVGQQVNAGTFTNSRLLSTTGTAMVFQGGGGPTGHNMIFNQSEVTGGNGTLLRVEYGMTGGVPDPTNPGSLFIRAIGSTLTGDMLVVDPGINRITRAELQGGSTWSGAALGVSAILLDASSTWNITGNSTLLTTVISSGTLAFEAGGPFITLTTPEYRALGGTIRFNMALGADASPTDQLIINGGTATGTTGIIVTNQGGAGAMTTGNGIAIVIAQNGGTTAAGAFHLAGPVAAGPFQYLLFRGPESGGTSDEQSTWYLRSHITATVTGPGPALPPGGGGNGGGGGGGGDGGGVPIPLYRPETASYALFPALARGLAVSSIGTFHERNGDQALAAGSKRERMWGRVFGEHSEHSHGGHVAPGFEGHAAGFQAGADVYETIWDNGVRGRTGLFVGWAEARGDIKGFVLGNLEAFAGDAQLEATSVGGYGTLIGPGGWYLDGIVMPSFYSGDGRSTNGIGVNADGWSLLGSLEAGMPFRLGGGLTLEPQAQLIYQHLSFDDAADPFSTVSFRTPDAVSGRIGVRLAAELAQGRVRPYLKANLWQDWLDKDGVIYAGTHRLDTEHGGTALEVGGGVVAELMPGVGLWGVIDYTTDIAGDTERETWRGNAGVRITW